MELTREEILKIIADLEKNIRLGDDVFKSMLALEWYKIDLDNLNKQEAFKR